MSENHTPESGGSRDNTVLYLLGAVMVLLAIIVGLVIVRAQGTTSSTTASEQAVPAGGNMPGVASSTGAPFDPATATKVPPGKQPEAFVKSYYQSILDKKWDAAFKMQPAVSQQGTVDDFKATQERYGMKSFKVVSSASQGATATVEVSQDLGQNGKWGATWVFVKSGANWLVKERRVTMNP